MLTLKKVKELVEAPSHAKRTPSPKMLFEEGIVLLRRDFDQGSHLTVYNSGYVLFSAGKRNTVFHIHDCQGDYAYDAAEGKGDVIEEEYFENCEWHIRALFEGERKMEDNQAKCEDVEHGNIEVILVDDGSPDKSGYIIDRLKEEDNRIVVIHQENHGVSSARNAGMAVASGEYITFVDGDDWVDANYVTYFVDLLEKSSCDVAMNKNNYSGCNDISNNNFSVISAEKAIEWIYLGD